MNAHTEDGIMFLCVRVHMQTLEARCLLMTHTGTAVAQCSVHGDTAMPFLDASEDPHCGCTLQQSHSLLMCLQGCTGHTCVEAQAIPTAVCLKLVLHGIKMRRGKVLWEGSPREGLWAGERPLGLGRGPLG